VKQCSGGDGIERSLTVVQHFICRVFLGFDGVGDLYPPAIGKRVGCATGDKPRPDEEVNLKH